MAMLFGGGGGGVSRTNATQTRGLGSRGSGELLDLLTRALIGNLQSPQASEIPVPLQQSISGFQDIAPRLFEQAYGASRGLAGRLGPPPGSAPGGMPAEGIGGPLQGSSQGGEASPAKNPGGNPTFGRLQSREELGLQDPEVVDPRYLPSDERVIDTLPPVRVPKATQRQANREDRYGRLSANRERHQEAGDTSTPWLNKRIKKLDKRFIRERND